MGVLQRGQRTAPRASSPGFSIAAGTWPESIFPRESQKHDGRHVLFFISRVEIGL
jgi:hypothetical protein